MRILIVDDEEAIREILKNFLEHHGYDCVAVPGGMDALKLLDFGEHFDLITTDIENWPMDGFAFRDALKKKYPGITVLVITAAPDIGYPHYLKKGFDMEDLLVVVRRLLASQWMSGQ